MTKEQNSYNPFAALKKSDFPDKPLGKSDKDNIPKTKIITPKQSKQSYSTSQVKGLTTTLPHKHLSQSTSLQNDESAFQDEKDSSLFFANMAQVQKLPVSTKELKRKKLVKKSKKNIFDNDTAHHNSTLENISLNQINQEKIDNQTKQREETFQIEETNRNLQEKQTSQELKSVKNTLNSSKNNNILQEQMLALKKLTPPKKEESHAEHSKNISQTTIIKSKEKANTEKKEIVEDDDALFFNALCGVQSLSTKGRDIPLPPKQIEENTLKVSVNNESTKSRNPYQEMVNNSLEIALHTSEDYIEAHVLGLDLMTVGKLQAREYKPEAHIDLHGLTVEHAYNNLVAFFRNAYQRGLRTVLVVTGKGKNSINNTPILRTKTSEWFTQDPFKRVILAFCTAKIEDGGAGALYVLIRKPKKDYGNIDWNMTPTDSELFL